MSKKTPIEAIKHPADSRTNITCSVDYVDGYTIFDVGGNKYRIAAVIHYDKQRLYIR